MLHVLQSKQLPAVLWDVVSGDPSKGTTTHGMIRTVLRGTRAGSIIVFHINGRGTKTAEALPSIIRELRARGFRFVQVSELLASASAPVPVPSPVAVPMVAPVARPHSAPLGEAAVTQATPRAVAPPATEEAGARDARPVEPESAAP